MTDHTADISPLIREKAPLILAEIKKAKHILLHCHPSPDPDSVGSALAMKFALEQMGKEATVIRGDSEIPQAFMHFPGVRTIEEKNFFEIDLEKFDLFISLDTASIDRISSVGKLTFPSSMTVIDIDHHKTNPGFGAINLVESSYPATCQILFDLFGEWGISLSAEIAGNLFIGIYTDTGGFKYRGTTARTFQIISSLVQHVPHFSKLIVDMENSNSPGFFEFQAKALSSVTHHLGGKLAISAVPLSFFDEKNISTSDIGSSAISPFLITVVGWDIGVALVEIGKDYVKASFRTRDADTYDVSRLAVAVGGGGHKTAAGATMRMNLEKAQQLVVAKAKELYNL